MISLITTDKGFKMFRVGLSVMPSGPCLTLTLADVCILEVFGSESENFKVSSSK
jgi:hypothetical protein